MEPKIYNNISHHLRRFFEGNGFIEVPAQSRLSILAACEDPTTVVSFVFDGQVFPLPQTGQMWLEIELLKNKDVQGVYCQTTSYRNEPFPIKGRHDKIFPMFEFESIGNVDDLKKLGRDLLDSLGFGESKTVSYETVCQDYDIDTIGWEDEKNMQKKYGDVIFLEEFPLRTHPFWNMKHLGGNIFSKADILLFGMETIGSAERSVDKEEMRKYFMSISQGEYARLLFHQFSEARVLRELDEYLSLPMIPRYGGGIGLTRLARALKLLPDSIL